MIDEEDDEYLDDE